MIVNKLEEQLEKLEGVEEKAVEVFEDVTELFDEEKKIYATRHVRYAALGGLIVGSSLTGLISYLIGRYRQRTVFNENVKVYESRLDDPNQLKLELDAERLPDLKKRWTDDLIPDQVIASMREEQEEEVEESVRIIQHVSPSSTDVSEVNVIEEGVAGWNYKTEIKGRKGKDIYIIHRDEYWANEKGYNQSTLTYYAGDEILVDEQDAPIYNHSNIVGELMFGHGSGDQNVVYIRNVTLEAEYEILLDQGHYTIEVLGLEAADQKPSRKKPPKFKSKE